ncbi:golgin subfamily B member 1-like [Daphnia pulicaria]|uniref:golgin subfamily B member 1-like n=1 Tax=Daphnia pulicaria TaxID=35523 RepID=UPI001EECD989|nr:golgin subfamily B member 1-like [Daphnia pulicaria]
MDSEIIYEALGEVLPIERKNGNKESFDEGFGGPDEESFSTMQPAFNLSMTDEAVVESIFNCCDKEQTGYVRASVLVEFLLNYASESHEIREKFQDMLVALDPTDTNPEVTIEDFQSALKFCINKLTSKTEDSSFLFNISSINNNPQSTQHHSKLSSNHDTDSRNSSSTESQCALVDVKELQFQFIRLQEQNNLLQEQMDAVEESNISLKSENSVLKNKINRVELTVTEIGQQSQLLEEDNNQLQSRVKQLKEDFQRMTVQYEECRKELDEKVQELETMQVHHVKGEERCEQLVDAIRHLEEIIRVKEEELEMKDKEIQRISQDLMDQQLLSDPVTPTDFDRLKGQELGENLAAELQSSLGDTPWKKQMGSVAKPDFIHPAAWNVMLNEPEYEDEPINRSSFGDSKSSFRMLGNQNGSPEKVICNKMKTHSCLNNLETQASKVLLNDFVHSTPISKIAPTGPINWIENEFPVKSSKISDLWNFVKYFLRIFFLGVLLLAFLALISVLVLLLLLSLSSTASYGCGGFSNDYLQQGSPYYSTSFVSKIFDMIKPYCQIEYHSGCPPV